MENKLKCGIVFFTKKGEEIFQKVEAFLKSIDIDVEKRNKSEKLGDWCNRIFKEKDIVVFISATGIAVRTIAPNLKTKVEDPAVLVIDDMGKFAISLVSGHVGGANKMTLKIGEALGSIPVITTSTDVSGKFAVDSWAVENGLIIRNIKPAKDISMEIINGKKIPITSCIKLNIKDEQIENIYQAEFGNFNEEDISGKKYLEDRKIALDKVILEKENSEFEKLGIDVSWFENNLFASELKLVPKTLTLGIGCRRGKSKEEIKRLVENTFKECGICKEAVKNIASIDLKKDEKGLIEFAGEMKVEFNTFSSEELSLVEGDFSQSNFVASITGVTNVCERAAVLGSKNGNKKNGKLLLRKRSLDGVTLAIATEEVEIDVE